MRKCPECDYQTNAPSNLKRHMRRKHNVGEKQVFTCVECGKSFSEKEYLKQHVWSHSHVFNCPECDFQTSFRTNLRRHMEKNHEEDYNRIDLEHRKKIRCPECDYQTIDSSNLKRHIRTQHEVGEKQVFTCAECGKSFFEKSYLKRHLLTHSRGSSSSLPQPTPSTSGQCPPPPPPPKYPCFYCSRSYRCREALDRHIQLCHHATGGPNMSVPQTVSTDKLDQTERSGENVLGEEDLEAATILMGMSRASTSTSMDSNTPHPCIEDQPRIPPDLPTRVQRWMLEDEDMTTSSSSGSLADIYATLEANASDSSSKSATED